MIYFSNSFLGCSDPRLSLPINHGRLSPLSFLGIGAKLATKRGRMGELGRNIRSRWMREGLESTQAGSGSTQPGLESTRAGGIEPF